MNNRHVMIRYRSTNRFRRLLPWVCIAAAVLVFWRCRPLSDAEQKAAETLVECTSYYVLSADGKPLLYFTRTDGNQALEGAAFSADSVSKDIQVSHAYWVNRFPLVPSCRGRIVATAFDRISPLLSARTDLYQAMQDEINRLGKKVRQRQGMVAEMDYYLKTHNVQDEGYNQIADYHHGMVLDKDSLSRVLKALKTVNRASLLQLKYVARYQVAPVPYGKRGRRIPLRLTDKAEDGTYRVLRTLDRRLPEGVSTRMSLSKGKQLIRTRRPIVLVPRTGAIQDSTGVYRGEYNARRQPDGYGAFSYTNGNYYEGGWTGGERDGFGFSVTTIPTLKVGEWKEDRYLGERIVHRSDRLYGIDIAKYQHEIGNKKYGIDWSDLRITSLGTMSKKTVSGEVDYPVSFVYIKSTEGTTVKNAYYRSDYLNARKHGILVGAYHFFSTYSDARQQAASFLKNTRFQTDDFPPVLDVEPSAAQIEAVGGSAELFRRVRTWLEIVEDSIGVRPILYVNQTFVNKYLPDAPDIMEKYQVWIARYGEYKPNVHLVFWQLCPDGKVNGIHGDVDINVFNGYQPQFEEFLEKCRIRR